MYICLAQNSGSSKKQYSFPNDHVWYSVKKTLFNKTSAKKSFFLTLLIYVCQNIERFFLCRRIEGMLIQCPNIGRQLRSRSEIWSYNFV